MTPLSFRRPAACCALQRLIEGPLDNQPAPISIQANTFRITVIPAQSLPPRRRGAGIHDTLSR